MYWCFGPHKNRKRIEHAVDSPETSNPTADASAARSQTQTTTIILPFVAPPSSPASFFQSEPPSVAQSPSGLLSLTSASAHMYSPGCPHSIFAIGPYANETQLVSPPVFSTFTTQPSTAPLTPPTESFHLTTPSSPEVPFAQFLDPNLNSSDALPRFPFPSYEFPSYQLSPGSPMGNLISPSSVFSVSGTSSPFAGRELPAIPPNFLDFLANKSPKLLELENRCAHGWGSIPESSSVTPDTAKPLSQYVSLRDSKVAPYPESPNEGRNVETMIENHRDSHELPTEEVEIYAEAKPIAVVYKCDGFETSTFTPEEAPTDHKEMRQHRRYWSITLGSSRDFNLEKAEEQGAAEKNGIGSAPCKNDNVPDEDSGNTKNWSFPVTNSNAN
ncbi:hypothetical protein SAY87_024804 [Trapa incisa]|uniref:Hydroxyproline-rich glycoprotein family protein n=1 Tax=Trapa incisa TaxID=236973 RepID=A0AAN7J8Y1_9MYRT|nr:hypothetical protein SAY87_024804 [Trapa incisa]